MIMLEPLGKGLLGTTLRYDYEVRSEKDYFAHIPSPRISKDAVRKSDLATFRTRSRYSPAFEDSPGTAQCFNDSVSKGFEEKRRRHY
jgi:non-homologous end joining protein Ku